MVESTMDLESWLRKQLEQAGQDLLRAMVKDFAEALMGAEADALCGAVTGSGRRSGSTVVTATGSVTGTRASARSSWPSPSCARAHG